MTKMRACATLCCLLVTMACSPSEGEEAQATSVPPTVSTSASLPPSSALPPAGTAAPATTPPATTPPATTPPVVADLPVGGPTPAGAPAAVIDRLPLPYCGAEVGHDAAAEAFPAVTPVPGAADCYADRAAAGLPVELITIRPTTEGDPILAIRRLLPDRTEETFLDTTRDRFGTLAWFHLVCAGYLPPGSPDENCEDSRELAAPVPAPAEAALVTAELDGHGPGPPFYFSVGPVVAGGPGAWATHDLTVVSEWATPITVAAAPGPYRLAHRALAPSPVAPGAAVVLRRGESMTVTLEIDPPFPGGPRPGRYEVRVPIGYWREAVEPADPPPVEGTAVVRIAYEVLDAPTAASISAFCDDAVPAAALLADVDERRLLDGVAGLEAAATALPAGAAAGLASEMADLRADLARWFGGSVTHGGFSTGGVVAIVSRLCGADLPAVTVQS